MLSVDEKLRNIYLTDTIPITKKPAYKRLKVFFPELNLEIPKAKVVGESLELSESICSGSELMFGGCESAQVKFTVADITEELEGKECIIS